jgi:putative membrane protein (TIGR04086 family)
MSNQRTLRNYAAGAAITFGIVLFTFQILALVLLFFGKKQEEIPALDTAYILMHTIGGLLGSYLVARRVEEDHIQVGVVTVIMAYVFESVYSLVFGERPLTDIWVLSSLLIGGIIGAVFAKSWRQKQGLDTPKTKPKTIKETQLTPSYEDTLSEKKSENTNKQF